MYTVMEIKDMFQIDLMENQFKKSKFKKGQFAFDLTITVIILSFILYFGLFTIAEIHKSNIRTLEEQILFNRLISVADYLVKTGAVETKENIYGSKAIYHHEITSDSFKKINKNELQEKLQLQELHIEHCSLPMCNTEFPDNICINRIILFNDETSILRVCGR